MISIIVVAAGLGTRLKSPIPKALSEINNKTLLEHTLDRISDLSTDYSLFVTYPENYLDEFKKVTNKFNPCLVMGGKSRSESIRNCIPLLPKDTEYVLVHDAARAFTPTTVFHNVIDTLKTYEAVIPTISVVDTLNKVENGFVSEKIDRENVVLVQTPQGFRANIFKTMYSKTKNSQTDDASLAHAMNIPIRIVEGDALAFKITLPLDLYIAEAIAGRKKIE